MKVRCKTSESPLMSLVMDELGKKLQEIEELKRQIEMLREAVQQLLDEHPKAQGSAIVALATTKPENADNVAQT